MGNRKLGALEVSELGAGCMSISANYGPPADKSQGIAVIRAAHDHGVTFFDTAEVYGPYTSETLVGEALAPFRDQVAIATKFGFDVEGSGGPHEPTRPHQEGGRGIADPPANRPHRPLLPAPGRPERPHRRGRRCGQGTVDAGKVLHFGLSEAGAQTIRRAHAVLPVAAVQTEYSSWQREPEHNGVLDTCQELGVGFVPWGPLGEGYLTGKIDPRHPIRRDDRQAGHLPALDTGEPAGQPAVRRPPDPMGEDEERDTGPDRAGLAAGAEAVHRPDPRHPQHRAPQREHGCPRRRTDTGRGAADQHRIRRLAGLRRAHGRRQHGSGRVNHLRGIARRRSE